MEFENAFTVVAPIDRTWDTVLDVERVAPCLPGAQVLERTGADTYKVAIKVKVGPMSMLYKGDMEVVERDDAAHRAVLRATAREARGQGTAKGDVTLALAPDGAGTTATMTTTMQLSGRAAAMGQGVIRDVAGVLTAEFAKNLQALLEADGDGGPAASDAAAATAPAATGVGPGGGASAAAAVPATSGGGTATAERPEPSAAPAAGAAPASTDAVPAAAAPVPGAAAPAASAGAPSAGPSVDGAARAPASAAPPRAASTPSRPAPAREAPAPAEASLPLGRIVAAVVVGRLQSPPILVLFVVVLLVIGFLIGKAV